MQFIWLTLLWFKDKYLQVQVDMRCQLTCLCKETVLTLKLYVWIHLLMEGLLHFSFFYYVRC